MIWPFRRRADLAPTVELLTRDLSVARVQIDILDRTGVDLRIARQRAEFDRDAAIQQRDGLILEIARVRAELDAWRDTNAARGQGLGPGGMH